MASITIKICISINVRKLQNYGLKKFDSTLLATYNCGKTEYLVSFLIRSQEFIKITSSNKNIKNFRSQNQFKKHETESTSSQDRDETETTKNRSIKNTERPQKTGLGHVTFITGM